MSKSLRIAALLAIVLTILAALTGCMEYAVNSKETGGGIDTAQQDTSEPIDIELDIFHGALYFESGYLTDSLVEELAADRLERMILPLEELQGSWGPYYLGQFVGTSPMIEWPYDPWVLDGETAIQEVLTVQTGLNVQYLDTSISFVPFLRNVGGEDAANQAVWISELRERLGSSAPGIACELDAAWQTNGFDLSVCDAAIIHGRYVGNPDFGAYPLDEIQAYYNGLNPESTIQFVHLHVDYQSAEDLEVNAAACALVDYCYLSVDDAPYLENGGDGIHNDPDWVSLLPRLGQPDDVARTGNGLTGRCFPDSTVFCDQNQKDPAAVCWIGPRHENCDQDS